MPGASIGVDPGMTGALALLYEDMGGSYTLEVEDMPVVAGRIDPYALARVVAGWPTIKQVAVEQVHAMPKQGVSSTFRFGEGYGVILGVLAALERPVVNVPPSVWCKAMQVGADKDIHRRRAMDLWPGHADLFARKKDDGRADAALIALWASQRHVRGAA